MRKQSCYFILPGLAQTCEVEIIESLAGISRRSVDQFRNKTVNVRIPLKASSESMESGNHTESVGIFEIAVQVVIVLVVSDSAGFAAFFFSDLKMFSLVIFMMVLRAAAKRRSRAFLFFLKKKRYCSGMVKTICLCLTSRHMDSALTASCF